MAAPNKIDVAVLGAGPYGLSFGAHLAARGVQFRVFGSTMHSWRSNMPKGMYLKSPGRASNLSDPGGRIQPSEQFCRSTGRDYSDWAHPISGELFTLYGEWFQREPRSGSRHRTGAFHATPISDGFLLRSSGAKS